MPSAIDATKPVQGNPTTESVRDNFAAAKSEIEVLQLTAGVGPTGPPGPTGPAGSINVNPTVITSNAGTNASVTVGGTPQAATLQFTIPRGDAGTAGGGITETQAVNAVRIAAPDFSEDPATLAVAAAAPNLAGAPIVNPGWTPLTGGTPNQAYTHEPGGGAGVLAYPITGSMLPGQRFDIAFTGINQTPLVPTVVPPTVFTVYLRTGPIATAGQITLRAVTIPAATTFMIEITGTATMTHLVVLPAATFDGTFTLTRVQRQASLNSPTLYIKGLPVIQRGNNLAIGGGGRSATGTSNTSLGRDAMKSVTSATQSTMVGYQAGEFNIGTYNTVYGWTAFRNHSDGISNTALGARAMEFNYGGGQCVAVGIDALRYCASGNGNNAFGRSAIAALRVGSFNTATGGYTMAALLHGSNNTALGNDAGRYLGTGTTAHTNAENSVFIGYQSRSPAQSQENQIVIGASATGHGSNTITLGNGNITALHCNVDTISLLSDSRVKEDIQSADLDICLNTVKSLPLSRWAWQAIAGAHLDKHVTGFLAEDVAKAFPKSVTKKDEALTIRDANGKAQKMIVPVPSDPGDDSSINNETIEIDKTEEFKDLQRVQLTEILPTLWGAVQRLIQQIDELTSGQPAGGGQPQQPTQPQPVPPPPAPAPAPAPQRTPHKRWR